MREAIPTEVAPQSGESASARSHEAGRAILANPARRRALWIAVTAGFVLVGLYLPPIELASRVGGLGYQQIRSGQQSRIESDPPGALLEVSSQASHRSARAKLTLSTALPSNAGSLPAGRQLVGHAAMISIKGTAPSFADLFLPIDLHESQLAYIDPYGWDGSRWRWLPVTFSSDGLARIRVSFDTFVPSTVALTLASGTATEISAVLLPPPSVVPAAVAELTILEMAAFHLASGEGHVIGDVFAVPARAAGRFAVVDNFEDSRLRSDWIANLLTYPESRRLHRQALAELAKTHDLAGLVLDYRGIPGDLYPIYAEWLGRLGRDLDAIGVEVVVVVPMPLRRAGGWDSSPASWSQLSAGVDGLRVLLPTDEPLEIEALDDLVRWALGQVDRRKLQLALPMQGSDVSADGTVSVGFGASLAHVLDMARSDAPPRLSPGEEAVVELPALRDADLVRDPSVGMWRFFTWDDERKKHTIWINDAKGLTPAFQIAARYRLGLLALHGVEAGLDPALWPLVRAFRRGDEIVPTDADYQLEWQLLNAQGEVVREAHQPLGVFSFRFSAPADQGEYELRVDLVTAEGQLVAPGLARDLAVAPPPPPPPTPTAPTLLIEPTRSSPATRPPPVDELAINREPVLADVAPVDVQRDEANAVVSLPEGVLRTGPGVQHAVVSSVRQGERLTLAGRSANERWLLVTIEATGVTGWIRDAFVSLNVDPSGVPVIPDEPEG